MFQPLENYNGNNDDSLPDLRTSLISSEQMVNTDPTDDSFEPVDIINQDNAINQESVIPPTFTQQSSILMETLQQNITRYSEASEECRILCGRPYGNIILVPCGHRDYCFDCLRNHCSINDEINPRMSINCPDCNAVIENFIFIVIR